MGYAQNHSLYDNHSHENYPKLTHTTEKALSPSWMLFSTWQPSIRSHLLNIFTVESKYIGHGSLGEKTHPNHNPGASTYNWQDLLAALETYLPTPFGLPLSSVLATPTHIADLLLACHFSLPSFEFSRSLVMLYFHVAVSRIILCWFHSVLIHSFPWVCRLHINYIFWIILAACCHY